jgi:class 3 adenylate cyclase/tetratricopeptide (TPR) repeat protein
MSCATPLPVVGAPGAARKTLTVVFCDVVGSTPLAERLDPEAVRSVMTSFFEQMRAILERHGGTVEKYIGDAIMAVFGVPTLHEDDALRAVRAVIDMRLALGPLNEGFESSVGVSIATRTGVNTGEVVVGDGATGPTVLGDAVNVAARLQTAAAPGEILLGRDTYVLVRDSVEVAEAASLVVKGKSDPVTAYRLIELTRDIGDLPPRAEPKLVGRVEELRTLRAAFDESIRHRGCRMLTVVGGAGAGKSRLAHEFAASMGEATTVAWGRCLPYGEGITFWPVAEVVKHLAGIQSDDPRDTARSKLATLLEGAEEAELLFWRVAAVTGLADVSAGMHETFWAIRRLLEWTGRERPLVLVFDDLQWAEPTFLDLLDYLARSCSDVSILVLCLARTDLLEERPAWAAQSPNSAIVHLAPLADDEITVLIDDLLHGGRLDRDMRDRIAEVGGGNPLFVEEMLHMLGDYGVLERPDSAEAVAVPPTIYALVGARLDRLTQDERTVIRCASVIGKQFWWGAVLDLVAEDLQPRVGTLLQSLVRRELISPDRSAFVGEDAFRFHHLVIQEAAYRETPKQVRAELHRRFADWLERAAGDRRAEYEEILAYHVEQAARCLTELGSVGPETDELVDRAASGLASAGRRALARGDMSAAANLLARAYSVLPLDDPRQLEIMPELGETQMEVGELRTAEHTLTEAVRRASAAGDRGLEARARIVLLLLRESLGPEHRSEEAMAVLESVIPVLKDLHDDLGLAKAWRLMADVHWTRSAYAEVDLALERSIEHARRAGNAWEEAEALRQYAGSGLYGPAPVADVVRRCDEIIAATKGNRSAEAGALRSLGAVRAMQGRFEEGRALVRRSKDLLLDLGLRLRAGFTSEAAGFLEMLAGDPAAAERELREGYEEIERLGERGYLSTVAATLAHVVWAQGRLDEADALSRTAEEVGAEDDLSTQVLWRSARAKVHASRGASEGAEALARDAVRLAGTTDDINMRGDTLMDLAQVLALSGQLDAGREAAEEARALYTRKGNDVSAAHAERFDPGAARA